MSERKPSLRSWPENTRDAIDAHRRVAHAIGKGRLLTIATGYGEGLSVDEGIHSDITAVVDSLVTNRLFSVPNDEFYSIRDKVPVRLETRPLLIGFSNTMDLRPHVETVRNLFTAQGNPLAERMSAYRYLRVKRIDDPSLATRTMPDVGCPTEEYYIVGLESAGRGTYQAAGLLSLSPSSLELIAISDATMRLEPGEPLTEASVSAMTRVYDLVTADQEMGLAA